MLDIMTRCLVCKQTFVDIGGWRCGYGFELRGLKIHQTIQLSCTPASNDPGNRKRGWVHFADFLSMEPMGFCAQTSVMLSCSVNVGGAGRSGVGKQHAPANMNL